MPTHPIYREVEPSAAELSAIEAEWPVIAAELALVAAECRLAASTVNVLAGRAYRRAVRRLLAVLVAGPDPVPTSGVVLVAA
jgi:Family of unknown function (DUF6284)